MTQLDPKMMIDHHDDDVDMVVDQQQTRTTSESDEELAIRLQSEELNQLSSFDNDQLLARSLQHEEYELSESAAAAASARIFNRITQQRSIINDRRCFELARLPTISYQRTSGTSASASNADCENSTCSICFEDYEQGEKLRVLACIHRFHDACIARWMRESRLCPLCQKDALNIH